MLVQPREFIYEAHDLALVHGRLARHPLGLREGVLDVVKAWRRTVNLRDLARESLVFFVLVDFSL